MDCTQAEFNSPRENLLIVDDTPENLRVLSALLLKEGYGVRQAINGQMALATVNAAPPDLILLDIMMPDLDGYEVCQTLKSDQRLAKIPVIFLSASNEGFNKAKAFAVGGADYVSKPFQIEEILARIRNQLSLRAAEKENELLNAQLEERVKERTRQLELAQAQLLKMALHDALTSLPNRPQFMERLQQAMQLTLQDSANQFAVLFLDCDRFKVINDSLGHLVGDELLMAIAHRLQALLPAETILARLGGDEFTILLTGTDIRDRAIQLAEKILMALSHSFQLSNRDVYISASIGIAIGACSLREARAFAERCGYRDVSREGRW